MPLRTGKDWLFEGGFRVAFIYRAQNEARKGIVNYTTVSSIDVFSNILKQLNIEK